jgi:hypothetical protein
MKQGCKKMTSLRDSLEVTDWIGMIILHFNQPCYAQKKLIVVEGHTDIGFFRNKCPSDNIHYDSPCNGKLGVLNSVVGLKSVGFRNAIGICDADFDHLLGNKYDDILLTDYHDIELMMITDDFISEFFHEYTDHRKYIPESAREIIDRIKHSIFDVCYKIGVLKFISFENNIGLNFEGMTYSEFIKVQGFDVTFDLDIFINHILGRTRKKILSFDEAKQLYEDYLKIDRDKLHICNGHDFTYILGMIYKEGHTVDKNISQDKIERVLRMSYHDKIFNQTLLARAIMETVAQ